jgi:hypothetical protein
MFILQLTVIDVSCGNINGVDAPFSNDLIKPDRSVRCEGEAPLINTNRSVFILSNNYSGELPAEGLPYRHGHCSGPD